MSEFRVAELSRHRFQVPASWAVEPLPSDGALHAMLVIPNAPAPHLEPGELAPRPVPSMRLEVVEGVGSREVLEQYVNMHDGSGRTETGAEAVLRAPRGRDEPSPELPGAEGAICRRVRAELVANDLVSVVLTWRDGVDDTEPLEHAAELALRSARSTSQRQGG